MEEKQITPEEAFFSAPKKPCKSVHYGSLSRAVPSAYGCNCVVKVYNDVAQAFEIYKA